MKIDWKDPMVVSILAGITGFIIALMVLSFTKPQAVMKVNENHEHGINWFKLIMLSIVMGLVLAIMAFLIMVQKQPTFVDPTTIKMQFSDSY